MTRVVLVTGVSTPLAAGVARSLSGSAGVRRVIGADSSPPAPGSEGFEFAHVDLHDGSLARIVTETGADTVLHLGLDTERGPNRENHVLGTVRMLSALQRTEGVRRLVVRAGVTLDSDDAAQVEEHTRALERRRPEMSVAVLRLANLIGPSVETPLTRYLDQRVVPTVLGTDPYVRFLHEDDAAEALTRMALSEESGLFDVAGADTVPLSDCLRRVGGQRLPVPARGLDVLRRAAKRGRIDYASLSAKQAVHAAVSGRSMDTGSLEHALGWRPSYSSAQAFEDYAGVRGRLRRRDRDRDHSTRGPGLRPVHVLALARATLGRSD